jgi:DHA2 family multidrug resistance protein-like MFS transporter
MNDTGGNGRAGRREWTGLAVLALPTLLASLDMSVLFLALPHLAADLDATSAEQLWILDVYGFLLAGFLVTMGTLGDRIGRRLLLLMAGAAAFGLASAREAFTAGMNVVTAVGAAVFAVIAVVALVALRHRPVPAVSAPRGTGDVSQPVS